MKTIEFIVTESGKPLLGKDEGFVIYGALFKADGEGGLLGNSSIVEQVKNVEGCAYTNFEFLDALCLDATILEEYIRRRKPAQRMIDGLTKV